MAGTFGFPTNTEIEAELTYVLQQAAGPPAGGAAPGPPQDFGGNRFFEGVGDVAATSESASLRIHHSFVQLPDANYTPRAYDPRSGYFGISFSDRAARLGQPIDIQWIARHRLKKVEPAGQALRRREADRLLPRSRHARTRSVGASRRRAVVEPGLRGRRLSQRVPRRPAARGRPSPRRSLQRDQLGAPFDARVEHRRVGHRPENGRDHQGRRHAGLAACAAGLFDGRRVCSSRTSPEPRRHRELAEWALARMRSSRPTRSGTRSVSATTTSTARPAASRSWTIRIRSSRCGRRHARLFGACTPRDRRVGQGGRSRTATRTSRTAPTRPRH